jgi:ribonuclease G
VKGSLLLLTTLPDGRTAAARMVDGRLEDLLVDPPPGDPAPRPGAIHLGVLGRTMKGAGGAFVDLGGGQSGFLRETRGLAPGRQVLVQVTGWAEAHKAAPVSRRLLVKGRLAILTPGAPGLNLARSTPPEARPRLDALAARAMSGAPGDLGLVLRTAAIHAADDEILGEIAALRDECARLAAAGAAPARLIAAPTAAAEARRDWPDPGAGGVDQGRDAFDLHGVWEAVGALQSPSVLLPGGARLHVEPTRALVAVDVDTGSDASPAAALKANLAAARELPRQLRLRGLGGPVLVDFAPLPKKDRQRVADALKAALARDGIETTLAGWTPLGNLELLRKRTRRPLADLLQGVPPPGP